MVIKRMIDPPNFGEAVSLPSPRTTDARDLMMGTKSSQLVLMTPRSSTSNTHETQN